MPEKLKRPVPDRYVFIGAIMVILISVALVVSILLSNSSDINKSITQEIKNAQITPTISITPLNDALNVRDNKKINLSVDTKDADTDFNQALNDIQKDLTTDTPVDLSY